MDIARLHSGDLSVYSTVAEQIRRLKKHRIDYTLTPGVPAFAAAASVIQKELTVPEIAQTVVLTRTSGRASAMPEKETLEAYAATGATLVLHLPNLSGSRRRSSFLATGKNLTRNIRKYS